MDSNLKQREENCKSTTSASVVEIVKQKSGNSINSSTRTVFYKPVLEFYASGVYIKNTYFAGTNPCPYYVGQSVIVRYNINNPENTLLREKK